MSGLAKPGYIGAMIRKLTNNLQVEFRNIHVRYEDSTSNPDVSAYLGSGDSLSARQHPFAAGVTMAEFKMVSTDENWAEAFIEATAAAIHKVCHRDSCEFSADRSGCQSERTWSVF